MLTWWAFNTNDQPLLDIDTTFEIEHIFARKRQESQKELQNPKSMDLLGNKSLLERKINIRASDYRWSDKVKYYKGELLDRKQNKKEGTKIVELLKLSETNTNFIEADIEKRNNAIFDGFIDFLKNNNLIQQS